MTLTTGARPAPKFKWTIGDNEILNSNTTTSEELLDEGRGKVNFFHISILYTSNFLPESEQLLSSQDDESKKKILKPHLSSKYLIFNFIHLATQ